LAVAYKFIWDKGTTIARSLIWKRNAAAEGDPDDYQPVDLTGYIARMEIKDKYDGLLLYRMDTASGRLVIDAPNGAISFEIPASVTEEWTWRNAVYDLEVIDSSGRVTRLIQGTISLTPEVTTGD
jgi:hypothetical protein